MSATCSPLISIYCGEAHRCTEIRCLSGSAAPRRGTSLVSAVTCLKVTFKQFVIKGWHFLFFVSTLIQLTISCIVPSSAPREQVWTCCIQLHESRSCREPVVMMERRLVLFDRRWNWKLLLGAPNTSCPCSYITFWCVESPAAVEVGLVSLLSFCRPVSLSSLTATPLVQYWKDGESLSRDVSRGGWTGH